MSWVLATLLAAMAPATDPGPAPEADPPPAETPSEDGDAYGPSDAARDAGVITRDTGKAYLHARARLVDHPELAAEALTDQLKVVPPPGPAEHKRILDVLAELSRPEDLPRFAQGLARAALRAPEGTAADAIGGWRQLLLRQGPEAVPHLVRLVGDTRLPRAVRAALIQDLVQATEASAIEELVALVGPGDRHLQQVLRRALRRRALANAELGRELIAATDAAMADASATRLPRLVALRTSLTQGSDPGFVRALVALLQHAQTTFGTQVAAVRALGRQTGTDAAVKALTAVGHAHLGEGVRASQTSEILGWLALSALPPAVGASLVSRYGLLESDAPRLAAAAYRVAELDDDYGWLGPSQANPWPQVRQAALSRVTGPCPAPVVRRLADAAGDPQDDGEPDGAVARAAAVALGRCNGPHARQALERILEDRDMPSTRRAVAGAQLVRRFGRSGTKTVASVLAATPPRPLGRSLARTLRHADPAHAEVRRGLCAATEQSAVVAHSAWQSLRALYPATRDPC